MQVKIRKQELTVTTVKIQLDFKTTTTEMFITKIYSAKQQGTL